MRMLRDEVGKMITGYGIRYIIVVAVMSLLGACCTSPSKPMEVDDAINAWLTCEECDKEEFDVVTDYCEKYVAARLAAVAANGPSPEVLQAYENGLRKRYKARHEYAVSRGLATSGISEDRYVKIHLDAVVARYKSRASGALTQVASAAELGTLIADAQRALESAQQDELDGS